MKLNKNSIFAALLIMTFGSLASVLIVMFGEEEEMQVISREPLSVKTINAMRGDYRLGIAAWGFVEPQEEIEVCSEVGGQVSEVARNVHVGGKVEKGELLFSINDQKYKSILAESRGSTVLATQELEVEKGRQIIARKEWELLQSSSWRGKSNKVLALRVPQLKAKEAAVQIAAAKEQQAALDLKRTEIKAPCKGVILAENVAVGQLLNVGDVALQLGCIENYQILANYSPSSELGSADLPVEIRLPTKEYLGQIKAVSQAIDPETRQKQVLIEFDATQIPIGEYSRLTLPGRLFENVLILPKQVLRSEKTVWVLDESSTLEIRKLTVVGQDSRNIIVTGGVTEEDRIVVSQIASPLAGMQLRESRTESQISGVYIQ